MGYLRLSVFPTNDSGIRFYKRHGLMEQMVTMECSAKRLNINRLLLTIQNPNIASIKAALKNGGIIEEENEARKYVWINLLCRTGK